MTEPERGGLGCLTWLAVFIGLGALTAAIWFFLLSGGDDGDTTALPEGPGTTSPAASLPPTSADGCTDATEEFRRSAGPGLDVVRSVCWESDGRLRAEVDLPADINAGSTPAQALCTALTDFVTASGQEWLGFTAYSLSPFTPGRPVLARTQPDQPCQNPSQQ